MTVWRVFVPTMLAMLAFAANSVLCRLALRHTEIDAASFAAVRLVSGALVLWLLVRLRPASNRIAGSWPSALALFAYAAAFSFAYVSLPTGIGALLLFGSVQVTMIVKGLWSGERPSLGQGAGFVLAFGGLVALLLPGLTAPPLGGAVLMIAAGIAWGVYSLRGLGGADPVAATAGNFLRSVPMALALALASMATLEPDAMGVGYAVLSGAIASGLGYAVWYAALRGLSATRAASVQLSVPVIAALGGVAFLDEPVTLRLLLSSAAILGGIALVILERSNPGRQA